MFAHRVVQVDFKNIYIKCVLTFISVLTFIILISSQPPDIQNGMEMATVENNINKVIDKDGSINFTTIKHTSIEKTSDESKILSATTDFMEESTGPKIAESKCYVPKWNNFTSDFIEYQDMNEAFLEKGIGSKNQYLFATLPSVLAAFAYESHITVTLTSETYYGKPIYCRYYDCNRREIPNPFNATVFPEMTVHCGRRAGAEYISVSESLEEEPEYPVPIVRRTEPQHYFTVCMATLYGDEPKFLPISDFIEYYKTQGATFFHVYVRNVTEYDRLILDDYVRTGEVELIKMHDHFWRNDFMWHHPQINDCHHRNKYFSKWTAVVDFDERIEMKNDIPTIAEYLEKMNDPIVTTLRIRWQYVIKDQYSPDRYLNDEQIISDMLFHKFHNTSKVANETLPTKCIIRPESVSVMSIHAAYGVYKGVPSHFIAPKDMVVRHYRNIDRGALLQHNVDQMFEQGPFRNTSMDTWIEKLLTERILYRVKNVYADKKKLCYKKGEEFESKSLCWAKDN